MEFRSITRAPGAFQQSVRPDHIELMCRRMFGASARVVSAIELGNGRYNNTYRINLAGEKAMILRVAPEPHRQYRIERELMRNEYAGGPFLAPIASMIPHTLAADFTHSIIDRDYVFQTMLDGVPGPQGIGQYPRLQWAGFFHQLGKITRTIHAVSGEHFGPVAGPHFDTWSEALIAYFTDLAADIDDAELDATDIRKILDVAEKRQSVLDEVTTPRLLHGDLWTVNVMMQPNTPEPTISGVFDNDRTMWGDPEADWPIYMADKKPGAEREAFWKAYAPRPSGASAAQRSLFYQAKHIGAIRLERYRLGKTDTVPETYRQLQNILDQLHR